MAPRRVVVVGASLAGIRAAETLRRDGHDGPITLIGAERHLPYDRPPLSKQVLAGTMDPETTDLRFDPDLGACPPGPPVSISTVAGCTSTGSTARTRWSTTG
jgi:NADPH-dependent 2,4-dienoyl-CoA reductase/sulfur reductase-like enzyme